MTASIGLLALLCAMLFGAAANWAADVLPGWQNRSAGLRFNLRMLPHYSTLWWYPWRRGVCPHCGEVRHWRLPVLELSILALFLLCSYLIVNRPTALFIAWLYTTFLLTVLVIDYEQRRVLNIMLGPAALFILALSFLPMTPDPLNALSGAAAGLSLFLLLAFFSRGSLGAGDVKLAGVIGLMLGYPNVLTALICGVLLGGVVAVVLLVSKRAGRKSTMAYAPYLAVGTLVTLVGILGG